MEYVNLGTADILSVLVPIILIITIMYSYYKYVESNDRRYWIYTLLATMCMSVIPIMIGLFKYGL